MAVVSVLLWPADGLATTKKLIEFGWDEPDPAFMRQHIAEMEASPFDGCVYHLTYRKPDGSEGLFIWDCWSTRRFTEAELQPAIDDLLATPFRRFRSNFLRFNTAPADLDWFDDYGAVIDNARLAASIAKRAGSAGIMFDVEQYNGHLFEYAKQRDAGAKSWNDYAAQARLRGRQVMDAFQDGYPDLTVFLTLGYSPVWIGSHRGVVPLRMVDYGLLAPFLDGMLDAARGRTRMIDGHELSYGERDPRKFRDARKRIKKDVLGIVADRAKYSRVFSASFGIWMDNDWKKHGWNVQRTDKNYMTPPTFRRVVREALLQADEYVWIYTEQPRWWTKEGGSVKLPAAYKAALRQAKTDAARARPVTR